jgi:NAD(P)-dependent dehydrogenase (short-subunit alcohol dehydrogenase family)
VDAIDFKLSGQVAIVTGASRGIGHDLVLALAAAGAVVVAAARSASDVADLVADVQRSGGDAVGLELDVTDVASSRRAVERLVADTGKIDILVNNAGLGSNHDAVDVTEADWDEMMAVNLRGLFFITQAVARPMIQRGYGRIINISSQAGLVGIPRHAVYCAARAGSTCSPGNSRSSGPRTASP